MSNLKKSLNRINNIVGLYQTKANYNNNNESRENPRKENLVGGCIFSIDSIRIYFAGFFADECKSLGGLYTDEPCNENQTICYRGIVQGNSSSGSSKHFSKSDLPSGGGNCELRYPDQPEFNEAFDANGRPLPVPNRWFGGGNNCGDPYIGWHPLCKVYLGQPVNKNSKLKGKNGKVKLFSCGQPVLEFAEGEVPVPIINIWIDTRDLEITSNRWPLPGTHVVPGPFGPPRDGGIWRGFRPAGSIINPEFIKFIKEKAPQCIKNICNGGLSGFNPNNPNNRQDPNFAVNNLVHRCSLSKLDICKNNEEFENFIERNFPEVVSGGTGIRECEKALCGFISNYVDHIAEGNENVFSWRQNYGPVTFDPRNICPILTGVGQLNAKQQEVKSKCAGAMDFLANLYDVTQPNYGATGSNSLEDGCYNCLAFLNPETLEWLSPDFPWSKNNYDMLDLMLKLVEKGYDTDWICDQGCAFTWLCSIQDP